MSGNNWINFVRQVQQETGLSYKDALKVASQYYEGNSNQPKQRKRKAGKRPGMNMKRNKAYQLGHELGLLLGSGRSGQQQKGLLANLLSGLNASIKIE
jgi:hypothetical protein